MLQVQVNDCLRADLRQFCDPLQVSRRCRRHPAVGHALIGVSGQTRGSEQLWTCGFLLLASARIERPRMWKFPFQRCGKSPESVNLISGLALGLGGAEARRHGGRIDLGNRRPLVRANEGRTSFLLVTLGTRIELPSFD